LQLQLEDEQRQRDDLREQYNNSEKRSAILQSEKEELSVAHDAAERARRQAEHDAIDLREQVNDFSSQAGSLGSIKRKLESELQALHAELDDSLNELKNADERAKKAVVDAARFADELRQEQEHSNHIERLRKGLEQQVKDMQGRLDEAEQAALKGGKKVIQKLEQRVREVEQELEGEQRRHSDTDKKFRTQDRRIKELEFQIEEDKKSAERMNDLVDKLQQKLKVYKRQIDEAEEIAATNLAKYRQVQTQIEDAEERADVAENSLTKLRAKNRSSASIGPLSGGASSSVLRSPSRARASGSALNYD
jgi:chromosome segregation ATPase